MIYHHRSQLFEQAAHCFLHFSLMWMVMSTRSVLARVTIFIFQIKKINNG